MLEEGPGQDVSGLSRKRSWLLLVATWAGSAGLLYYQYRLVRDYLGVLNGLGMRGAAHANTPRTQMFPSFVPDAQVWVQRAFEAIVGHDLQLHKVYFDNAPFGRPIHWDSAWVWILIGAGHLQAYFAGTSVAAGIEQASIWLPPAVLFVFILLISCLVMRRFGLLPAVVIVVAMSTSDDMNHAFAPANVDHHGLVAVSIMGLIFGAVCMGAGWWRENSTNTFGSLPISAARARQAAVLSGIFGAWAMWISAASAVPPIAFVGIAGAAAMFISGRKQLGNRAHFDPGVWRIWGGVGAALTAIFYCFEYFPYHLVMRLEVINPLYALAWLGGAELVAQIGEYRFTDVDTTWREKGWVRSALAVAGIASVPVAIAIGGATVFAIGDPFIARIFSPQNVGELQPLWVAMNDAPTISVIRIYALNILPLAAAFLTMLFVKSSRSTTMTFMICVTLLLTIEGWRQVRWQPDQFGATVCLILVLIEGWSHGQSQRTRWAAAFGALGLLYVPGAYLRNYRAQASIDARKISPQDYVIPLYRDIATSLRASQPKGSIVVMSGPITSAGVSYYGDFKSIGTLYWENASGLRAAAGFYAAPSAAIAESIAKARGVTHVVILSGEEFLRSYYQALEPSATDDDIRHGFMYGLIQGGVIPDWLERIPYQMPADLVPEDHKVLLYKVNFGQLDSLKRELATRPTDYRLWLQLGGVLASHEKWSQALDAQMKGISLAPVTEREHLSAVVAARFYSANQPSLAIHIYRLALENHFSPDIASYLAWVLATSPVDSVRNAPEALVLAERAVKSDPNSPAYLHVLAAAFADAGRFPDAVKSAQHALQLAKNGADSIQTRKLEDLLRTLSAGRPIRQ